MPRRHLRTRVLLLTGAFVLVLFAITFGLSWRARTSQERWTRIISVEMKTVSTLEELIRAQNAFHARHETIDRYPLVTQILEGEAVAAVRARMNEYRAAPSFAASQAVVRGSAAHDRRSQDGDRAAASAARARVALDDADRSRHRLDRGDRVVRGRADDAAQGRASD
jgi:hypothetical protein